MIKSKLAKLALVTLGVVAIATGSNAATYTAGDLILGFRSSDAGQPAIFEFNLGAAIPANGFLGNIGDILTANYGATWYSSNTVFFGVVGAAAVGDPVNTIYTSMRRTSATTQATAPGLLADTTLGDATTKINDLASSFANATAAANTGDKGVLYASNTALLNTWSDYAANSGSDFGVNSSLEQRLDSNSNQTIMGITQVEGAVDLFRTTTGNSPNNTGVYQTTIVIRQNGDIHAVPEPSTFAMLGIAGALGAFIARRKLKNKTA